MRSEAARREEKNLREEGVLPPRDLSIIENDSVSWNAIRERRGPWPVEPRSPVPRAGGSAFHTHESSYANFCNGVLVTHPMYGLTGC